MIKRLWNKSTHRFVRFLFVGGLNALFGFSVYTLFAFSPLPTWIVLIISNVAGISFNFFTTGSLVFRDLSAAKIPRFVLSYAIVFFISLELIRWLSPLVGGRVGAMAVIILPIAVLTYCMQLWFVFGVGLVDKDFNKL